MICYNTYRLILYRGDYSMKIINIFKHLHLVNKHRWIVFKLSVRAGIPFRGVVHDLSKYSPTEFFEGVKYFNGKKSPISVCKKENGYSKAWLHHKGRNKHHFEYWYDFNTPDKTPVMPYKYTVELICDTLAAGMAYQGKSWKTNSQIGYFEKRRDLEYINENIKKVIREVYKQVDEEGINKTINKKNLKYIYHKYVK